MNEFIAKAWKTLSKLPQRPKVALAVVIGILIGIISHWGLSPAQMAHEEHAVKASGEQTAEVKTWWTCSMHPEIRLPKPGLCPKCRMKLIPVRDQLSGEMAGMRQFTISENAKALMDVETAMVERKFVTAQIRMVGKVEYDETRLAYLTAWVPGRLDRLYVDYTGVSVNKGDHMVYLYSPELLSAQEELLQAIQAVQNVKDSGSEIIREVTAGTLVAAREKLRLWGLNPEQIEKIEEQKTVSDHITIYAPTSGIVIHRSAQLGMYVKTGTRIYTIADLSHVWVKLDAYESDLMWLRYGQEIEFTVVSYPGELFRGTISFIDPVLNPTTRTIKIRVDVPNPDGRLKPEMFVHAVVRANVAAGGKVMDPKLAGKWICPMHPSVVKDEPGKCDICEMPLVETESLGYISAYPDISEKPLVIPVSAALVTGTRAIVYVELTDKNKFTYEGREIVLGPRAGDYYLVRSGLKEGELVVTMGNFKIDSALQIQAKPSMMTPEGGGGAGGHQHGEAEKPKTGAATKAVMRLPSPFQRQLNAVLSAGDEVKKTLKDKDLEKIKDAFIGLGQAIEAVDMKLIKGHTHMLWVEMSMRLTNDVVEGKDIKTLREAERIVESLKTNIASLQTKFGLSYTTHPKVIKIVNPEFRSQLEGVFKGYFAMHKTLVEDQFDEAIAGVSKIKEALAGVDMKLLFDEDHQTWMRQVAALEKILSDASGAEDIELLRESFATLSEEMFVVGRQFGPPGESTLYQLKCPMAFSGSGATWLQQDKDTRNPYLGSAMLQCGDVVDVIRPANDKNIGGHQHD